MTLPPFTDLRHTAGAYPACPSRRRWQKTLRLVTTSGDRAKAQPMIDSVKLCAQFLAMRWGGELWGKGGPPDAVKADTQALGAAAAFLSA